MKKLFVLIISSLVLLTSLCGCSFKAVFSSHSGEYLVSAMGFDEKNGKFEICLEAIIVNTEDTEAEPSLELISGSGNTVKEAFFDAAGKTSQELLLSHCGIIALGESVTPDTFSQINEFCRSQKDITISAMFISCKDSKKLLSSKAISSVAVGYDIMSMLSYKSKKTGINYKNRFYEIESFKGKPQNLFSLPFFEKTENGYFINGLKIYDNYAPLALLDSEQTAIFSVMTDTQSKGSFMLEKQEIFLNSSYAMWNVSKNSNLDFTLSLRLETKNSKEKIKNSVQDLFRLFQENGKDIFGLGNIIYTKNHAVWDDIKKDYQSHFKNSTLRVEFI